MIRRLLGRLAMLYRPWWLLPAMVVGYLMVEAPYAWLIWYKGVPVAQASEVARTRDLAMILVAFCYGCDRVLGYHPLYWTEYGRWLARTPWRSPQRLPLGPLHLGLRDVAFVSVAMLLMHDPHVSVADIPFCFLIGYLAALCWSYWFTDTMAPAYVIAFGMGLAARVGREPWIALGVLAALYPVALLATRQSLNGFPWAKANLLVLEGSKRVRHQTAIPIESSPQYFLGWPFGVIQPSGEISGIRHSDGVLISLLVGWWAYCLSSLDLNPEDGLKGLMLFAPIVTFGAAAGRLVIYCRNYRAPINFFGRLLTFRWIIPGYDKVFLAPLGAIIAFPMTIWLGGRVRALLPFAIDPRIVVSAAIAVTFLVALNVGPSLRSWRLTGNHRIVPQFTRQTSVEL
jgi:hypothetical protein